MRFHSSHRHDRSGPCRFHSGGRRRRSSKDPARRAGARGTAWHRSLLEVGEKWRAAEGAGAEFVVYGGGSQGGEADMVRRMRVGQLNAAMLSVIGLTEMDISVGALQKMPLVFRSWDELDYVRERLRPQLDQRFFDKGFVVLCWGDAGWVQFISKTPALRPDDFRKMKIFAWRAIPRRPTS